jgi:hypothetical protein
LREEQRLTVFENRVLRRISGPKKEVDGSWRKSYNDDLHSLYSSTNIFRVIKSRRLSGAGNVTRMGEGRDVYRVLVGRPKVRDHWEDPGVGRRITLSWTLGIDGANWIWLSQDRVQWRAFVNMVMNLRVPQRKQIFFDRLSNYQLFKQCPAP